MDITGLTGSLGANVNNTRTSVAANAMSNKVNSLNSQSTEEELKGVIKDFESYFVEQVLKEMKDTLTMKDDKDKSTMSQYTDFFMDQVFEDLGDKLVDDMGEGLTQQLYEQMKRNYNID